MTMVAAVDPHNPRLQHATAVEDLKALTSLRFVAAMLIVVLHARNYFQWGWLTSGTAALGHGVSFFFVLSGFILTHVYSTKPMPSYGSFMLSRFARLWPVHAFAIIFLWLSVPAGSVTFEGVGMFNQWVVLGFNLALVHSVVPILSYTFSWNAVSWSISTEMFFYLAFPFLLVNIERTWHWKLLGAAAVAAATILVLKRAGVPLEGGIEQVTAEYATYPSPLVRGVEFCLGMGTWVVWSKYLRRLSLPAVAWTALEIGVLALCVHQVHFAYGPSKYWTPDVWWMLFIGPAGSCFVFALAIAVFAMGQGWLARGLAWRPFVFLGEISFSIYMLHQILMKACVYTFAWPDVPAALFLGVLLVLASASYLLVEKPGQRLLLSLGR